MKAIYLIVSSIAKRNTFTYSVSCILYALVILTVIASPSFAADLKILKMGLGSGSVTSNPAGINCGADCQESFGNINVTLTATADGNSTFAGWAVDAFADASTTPDCTGMAACVVSMSVARSIRPVFNLNAANAIPLLSSFTPEGIETYLNTNPSVDTLAEFIKALPSDFKQNWILMTRSESLQTGTAEFPRILLPNASAQFVFSLGVAESSSYPGAHPNAIEYMQWDPAQKNFRFHEIVLTAIPAMDHDADGVGAIPARSRGVAIDDDKCSKCHSSRNVLNLNRSVTPHVPGATVGTDGIPPGSVKAKNKPNWDPYDSWGGMMPFNRDRIYQGSVEAASFRKLLNPWTWQNNEPVRKVMEQLELQPASIPAAHVITRRQGGVNDGHINFVFDVSPPVLVEPAASGSSPSITNNYAFDGNAGTGAATSVQRGGSFITLHHSNIPGSDEGRGVRFFDALGGLASSDLDMDGVQDGNFNAQRIADELISHSHATGSIPIDIRPVALAVAKGNCLRRDVPSNQVVSNGAVALTVNTSFFNTRHGLTINQLVDDTRVRTQSMPLRKADIQKRNLDRTADPYITTSAGAVNGLIQQYGSATSAGVDIGLARIRQEVFRRPTTAGACPGSSCPDSTVMGSVFVDREVYGNTETVSLFRYFLEPLGVSVDKWSTGVRGRSRTYAFADVFGSYLNVLVSTLRQSLIDQPVAGLTDPNNCDQLITAINTTLGSLPAASGAAAIPKYTDIQRIFNKNCIECHGGLDYPPYNNYGNYLDFSENEDPPTGEDRLDRSHGLASSLVGASPPNSSFLYQRVTDDLRLINATDPEKTLPYNPATHVEDCPFGLMPCGGPPISQADILTLRRWMVGSSPNTRGDPHIKTVDGTHYDFQAAGEFVLLRDENLEVQTRQTAVATESALGPNGHTGLTSCVSLNTAVALKVGSHRISYQPVIGRDANSAGLELRVDGKPVTLSAQGIPLAAGRIIPTSAGGIQIETGGGTAIIVTPGFWEYYRLWHLNIDTRYVRATEGLMGVIQSGNWLPALPDGSLLGPRPRSLQQRYVDLYEKFGKAWRVTDASSLFDYAPGTSTQSFTIESWPNGESPQSCIVPQSSDNTGVKPPVKTLPLETAQQHCAKIVNPITRENCVQDVRVTGEPGFAKTYLQTEKLELNVIPLMPELIAPAHNGTVLTQPINFTWNSTTDADGDSVTYRHCVWKIGEQYNINNCTIMPTEGKGLSCGLIALLIGCLILIVLFLLIGKKKPGLLVLATIIILIAIILANYYCEKTTSKPLSLNTSNLESGKVYYWKVIAEDQNGGITESKTQRFEVK